MASCLMSTLPFYSIIGVIYKDSWTLLESVNKLMYTNTSIFIILVSMEYHKDEFNF